MTLELVLTFFVPHFNGNYPHTALLPQHNEEGNFGTWRNHIAQGAVVLEGAEEVGIMGTGVNAEFLLTRYGFQ